MFSFTVDGQLGLARVSRLTTPHGVVPGPFFQFVATQAAIRGMVMSEDLHVMGVDSVLANTYHLHLRPGEEIVAHAGGLHGFMQWDKAVTTDSGGYQVFSLGDHVRLDADGVDFRSPLNGNQYRFTPESTIAIQAQLGADIIMPLDVCTPYGASHSDVAAAVMRTTEWAKRCHEAHAPHIEKSVLYGIVQGSTYPDLREQSATGLRDLNFFGYSIGGELRDQTHHEVEAGLRFTVPHLPPDKPRYLMGSGTPEDIVRAVRLGVDQFDCVLPMRNARHGKIYRHLNEAELARCLADSERPVDPATLYETLDVDAARYKHDYSVFANGHPVITRPYSVAYVHHLLRAEPLAGVRLLVLQNIYFYVQLMAAIRRTIAAKATA